MVIPADNSGPTNISNDTDTPTSSHSNPHIVAIIIPIILVALIGIIAYIICSRRKLKRLEQLAAEERANSSDIEQDVGLEVLSYPQPPPAYLRDASSIERRPSYDKPPETSPPDTS